MPNASAASDAMGRAQAYGKGGSAAAGTSSTADGEPAVALPEDGMAAGHGSGAAPSAAARSQPGAGAESPRFNGPVMLAMNIMSDVGSDLGVLSDAIGGLGAKESHTLDLLLMLQSRGGGRGVTVGIASADDPGMLASDTRDLAALLPTPTMAAGLALSATALWWSTRAAGLFAALLTSVPAWSSFDPLPILAGGPDDDEAGSAEDDERLRDEQLDALADLDKLDSGRAVLGTVDE